MRSPPPSDRFSWLRAAVKPEWAQRGATLAARAALAREPGPDGVSGPPLRLMLAELGILAPKFGQRPVSRWPAARHPGPVMVLPGFGAHPARMRRMMRAMAEAGHSPHEWGLGFNLGPTPQNFAYLIARVSMLARTEGAPVALVGWSLGGLFAREIAKRSAGQVSCVITLGSPFSGDRRANNAWRAYQLVTGHPVDEPPIPGDFAVKPPVPTVALWSPRDGIVSPRSAAGWPGERDRAVAMRCTHLGFAADRKVIAEVLRQIDLCGDGILPT